MAQSLSKNEPVVELLGMADGDCMGGCGLLVLVVMAAVACVRGAVEVL